MIFNIDSSIVESSQDEILIFSKAIIKALENLHFVCMNGLTRNWFDKTIVQSPLYLGTFHREMIEYEIEMFSPSAMAQRYLRTVSVGKSDCCHTVQQMLFLAEETPVVVLENGKYDWIVLRKWVERYRKDKTFKNINADVHRAVTRNWVRDHNGGGKNNIPNVIDTIVPIYMGLHGLKIFTIFDSDKSSAGDSSKDIENSTLTSFLNQRNIEWHMLQKRKIENYFPLSAYEKAGLTVEGIVIPSLTPVQWDFINVNDENECKFISMKKSQVESLADNLTNLELQERVYHKDGEIDEVQEIILKLARFI